MVVVWWWCDNGVILYKIKLYRLELVLISLEVTRLVEA